jgi:hypothetical protein
MEAPSVTITRSEGDPVMPLIPRPSRALGVLFCAAALAACDGRAGHLQPTVSRGLAANLAPSPEAFASTEFPACAQPAGENPAPVHANAAQLSSLLHGVWVGERVVQDGSSQVPEIVPGQEPPGHYVMVFDMASGQGMVFEERGTNIQQNAFAQLLPAPQPGAPAVTNFYCGGVRYSAFRDRFVKVSNNPAAGLQALQQVTGVPVAGGSIHNAFETLHQAGYFSLPRQQSYVTMADFDVSVSVVRPAGSTVDQVRWDMVARYRGSGSAGDGAEPTHGTEGGLFQAVRMTNGSTVLVGSQVEVACNGTVPSSEQVNLSVYDETQSPDTDLRYTKIVVGPLAAL